MPDNKDIYVHRKHSKILLMAHLIFVTKYRKPLRAEGIWEQIKQLIYEYCQKHRIHVMEMESDKDHLHILIRYNPDASISEATSGIKQYTTFHIWKYYGAYLRTLYWKERTLWSDGMFACSVGNASKKTIEEYIRNQG